MPRKPKDSFSVTDEGHVVRHNTTEEGIKVTEFHTVHRRVEWGQNGYTDRVIDYRQDGTKKAEAIHRPRIAEDGISGKNSVHTRNYYDEKERLHQKHNCDEHGYAVDVVDYDKKGRIRAIRDLDFGQVVAETQYSRKNDVYHARLAPDFTGGTGIDEAEITSELRVHSSGEHNYFIASERDAGGKWVNTVSGVGETCKLSKAPKTR